MIFSTPTKYLNEIAAQREYVAASDSGVTFAQHGRQDGAKCWHWVFPASLIEPEILKRLPDSEWYLWSLLILSGSPYGNRIRPIKAALDWPAEASRADAAPITEFKLDHG